MPTRVVAAVVERGGLFLVCRRPAAKRHGGLWEFPGGKLLPGESLGQALARELHEELGVTARALGDAEHVIADPGTEFVIEFVRAAIDGEPEAREHDALAWLTPEELRALPLAPSDRRYAMERLYPGAMPR
jgi:(d)CTP diphosphatase